MILCSEKTNHKIKNFAPRAPLDIFADFYFVCRCTAEIEVKPIHSKTIWQAGWIVACSQLDITNAYGNITIVKSELPVLKSSKVAYVSLYIICLREIIFHALPRILLSIAKLQLARCET